MKKILATLLAAMLLTLCIPLTMITAYAEPIRIIDEFDAALNTADGEFDFENDEEHPWLLCADQDGNEGGAVMSDIAGFDNTRTAFTFEVELQEVSRLSFDYSTSTEHNYDIFKVYDNDSVVFSNSGIVNWANAKVIITEPGVHTFRFEYSKDISSSEGDDIVCVDNISILPMDPNASTLNGVMNAEGNNLTYVAEDNSWTVGHYNGRDCAKSNIESQPYAVAVLYTDCYIEAGNTITFDYATSSENGCDKLYFSVENIDDELMYEDLLEVSGENNWYTFDWTAPASGNYRLYWKYAKDGTSNGGMDAVFVADCNVPQSAISVPVQGDANMDGSLDVDDALLIIRVAIGADEQDEAFTLLCDMDSDGAITLVDAVLVLRSTIMG